jgi:hypothetical protein
MAAFPWLGLLIITLVTAVPYTALRLQTPTFARLVPGHARAIWRAQYAAWLSVGGLTALMLLMSMHLYATPLAQALATSLIAYSLMTLAMGGFVRPILWGIVIFTMLLPLPWRAPVYDGLVHVLDQLGQLSALVGLLWVGGLRALLPRLLSLDKRKDYAATALPAGIRTTTQNAAYQQIKPRGGVWSALMGFRAWSGIQQQWALSWPARWRLQLAMGPGFSPTAAVSLLPVALFMALLLQLVSLGTNQRFEERDLLSAFFPMMVIMVAGSGCSFMQGLALTRTEQSLACLLPGAPSGAQRGQWLASAIVRTAIINTALALGIALFGASLLGRPIVSMVLPAALIFAGLLSFDIAFSLRAPKRFADPGKGVHFMIPRVIVILAIGMSVMIGKNALPAIAPWVALWSGLCIAVAVRLYLRRMREAGALPAGNFG